MLLLLFRFQVDFKSISNPVPSCEEYVHAGTYGLVRDVTRLGQINNLLHKQNRSRTDGINLWKSVKYHSSLYHLIILMTNIGEKKSLLIGKITFKK